MSVRFVELGVLVLFGTYEDNWVMNRRFELAFERVDYFWID